MLGNRDKRVRVVRRGAAAIAASLLAAAALAGPASASQDLLKGGSVVLQLRGSHGLKLKPKTATLPITGGAIDPVDGSGTAKVSGSIKARKGKDKAKLKVISLTFGPNGAPGSVAVKVGKRMVNTFGKLSGGGTARDGWGARITGVQAKLSGKGAKALDFRGVKAGQPLGSVDATTVPSTVAVVPGSGEIVLKTDPLGPFVMKLAAHCIDPIPLTASSPGVSPIAPATTSGLLGTDYHFPVSGGAVAPDLTDGAVVTAGGQTIAKNTSSNPLNPSNCGSAPPAVGTKLVSMNFQAQFDTNSLASNTTLPDGFTLLAALGKLDYSAGTKSVDPNTHALTVTNAALTLYDATAFQLNQIFPNLSGDPSKDFAAGDQIGTVDVTGVKLR